MFRKAFSFGGMLLLTGAAFLATPSLGQSQHGGGHGGGGHGGGAQFGGGHGGGAHFGGYRGGINHGGGYSGGYRGGIYRGGAYSGGYRPYYGSYGYYPSYDSYGSSYPYYFDTYPDASYGNVVPYYGDGTTSAAPSVGSYQSFDPPATVTAQPDTNAHVTVNVPADAQIWFEGVPTISTGPVRQFDSPALTPGSQYHYEVRARWNENGRAVTQTQQVAVTAGARVRVDFPVPPGTAG